MSTHAGRRGVALISVLLIFFIATTVAVAMMQRQQIDIRQTANLLQREQAYYYARGAEEFALQILHQDLLDDIEQNLMVDHYGESWAQGINFFEIDNGTLNITITDLQGRFNINGIVEGSTVNQSELERFRRLLSLLAIEQSLADAIVDWIDSDQEPFSLDGAEDLVYLSKEPPYRTGDGPMACPSELLLIEGIDWEIYTTLEPHVVALPTLTEVNVNTASATVLQATIPNLDESGAIRLVEDRANDGFDNLDDFFQHPALAGMDLPEEGLSVGSSFFIVNSAASFAGRSSYLSSWIYRQPEGSTVIARQISPLPPPQVPKSNEPSLLTMQLAVN
ncbi:type II secretion system minor pseudopilin GspK [Desulfurispira natronophila]|uniref:General secretion pathway protein K n=1 Tax=Desulfurispira natronophila TaxID=682562 RepID=A0A7W7Y2H7_9BACT|nr:type II secretion system minor pseudopilin GspK [Desulfurispira natronophila]MBB5020890.1 general secretion pathway protein K [Desulfurispira natronophila]